MKKLSQNHQFRALLKERGRGGVNSYEPEIRLRFKQMARIVKDLEAEGCNIRHDKKKDGSTTYVLTDTPEGLQKIGVDFTYEIVDGIAIKKYL